VENHHKGKKEAISNRPCLSRLNIKEAGTTEGPQGREDRKFKEFTGPWRKSTHASFNKNSILERTSTTRDSSREETIRGMTNRVPKNAFRSGYRKKKPGVQTGGGRAT